MKKEKITEWLEWRYPDVFRDFKKHIRRHDLYCPDNGIHGQDYELLFTMIIDYFESYGLYCKSVSLDKNMVKKFAHINILLR
jgi:hypothetical protein